MGTIPQVSVMRGPIPISELKYGERLYKLFQKSAERYPANLALIYEDIRGVIKQLTFAELEEKTNRLARGILKQIAKKTPNNDGDYLIAVSIAPSDTLVMSLLAIWKAGCAYLPLDCNAPPERVRHILAESTPVLVLCETDEKEHLYKNIGCITYQKLEMISSNLARSPIPDEELASSQEDPIEIVQYTSGSSGLSKGVRMANSSIKNRIEWQWKSMPFSAEEKYCIFKTSLTFVDSVCEIWAPLLYPNVPRTIVIVPREITVNPQKLIPLLEKYKVGRLVLVPSLLRTLLLYLGLSKENENMLQNLKLWICSGETLPVSLAIQFFQHFHRGSHLLCNFYGSTEIAGDVTYHLMKSPDDVAIENKVPIGIPLDNTVIYLLDKDLNVVNTGEMGEIYVSGKNVTPGYVNGRDAFRFVESPHTVDPEHKILFKTGDYGRIVKDTLLYEGRTDSQLKVRGHRVDLSEIDSALNQTRGIDKAVALCYNPGEIDQQILAFVLLEDDARMTAEDVENELARSLPKYALPQVFIVKKMPYLVNGKIDRQYLLNYYKEKGREANLCTDEYDLTGVPKDKEVAAECLFKTIISVLGNSVRAKVTVTSNFYSLGGNSLNSVYTISKLREEGYIIGITDFINAKNLGEVLNKMKHEDDPEMNKSDDEDESAKKFKIGLMEEKHKDDVIRVVSESFVNKSPIEKFMNPPVGIHEYKPMLEGIWPSLIKAQMSLVALNNDGKLLAVSLVFDLDDEPELDLGRTQLSYILEVLDYIEVPVKENVIPEGKRLHSFMLGTDKTLTAQENIEVTQLLEVKLIEYAKKRGYIGILSTNTSPLTQQLAEVLNYKPIKSYQVNQYVALDRTRPFKDLPDNVTAVICWKKF
ncbi:hypothetical protein O3M35_012011 [Rhynocoris fuscipes]|uniref:Uncharacterized protein n=1 Tax=Rhynocoris fuscipes TaxID=488301 RepID=A0AAW1CUF9_9HEMI